MSNFELTKDQKVALEEIANFYLGDGTVHVLSGYAGTGKTTLMRVLLESIPKWERTLHLLNAEEKPLDTILTSTTSKASQVLNFVTGLPVSTIHSHFSIRPLVDHKTRKSTLVRSIDRKIEDEFIIIDEASQVDDELLGLLFMHSANCKFLFVGDPAQTIHHTKLNAPVFEKGYPTSELTEVVRQGNDPLHPIIVTATGFRKTVTGGVWPKLHVDNNIIFHRNRDEFDKELVAEFQSQINDGIDGTVKYLAWSNKQVVAYNQALNRVLKGTSQFKIGDNAICNSYINTRTCKLGTDDPVVISNMTASKAHGLEGYIYDFDSGGHAFMPNSMAEKIALMEKCQRTNQIDKLTNIANTWIDLRAEYACTVNKAQGSTYRKVFIDLDDIGRCRNPNQVARMLYVATSRPTDQIVFTGDLA